TDAVFAGSVARASAARRSITSPQVLSAFWPAAWMTQAGFVHRWISSHQTRSRGANGSHYSEIGKVPADGLKRSIGRKSCKKIVPIGLAGSSCSYEYRNNDR